MPLSDGKYFPCLIVDPSPWIASLSEARRIGWNGLSHYFFLTYDYQIDVLTDSVPTAEWGEAEDIRVNLEKKFPVKEHPYLARELTDQWNRLEGFGTE